jgi:NADP-dependent 3-hydroxy acid dehydrogenase YdfG
MFSRRPGACTIALPKRQTRTRRAKFCRPGDFLAGKGRSPAADPFFAAAVADKKGSGWRGTAIRGGGILKGGRNMAGRLAGKTALVTGGATGIGWGIAAALAAEGCQVAIAGRREDKLCQAAAHFTGQPSICFHTVDVAQRDSVERLFDWADKQLGRIDILINSAGVNVLRRTMAELSPDDWDQMLQINASGTFYCMRAVLPQMRQRRDGLIVNISSIAGKRSSLLGGVGYSAAKFAATALGTTVQREQVCRHGLGSHRCRRRKQARHPHHERLPRRG